MKRFNFRKFTLLITLFGVFSTHSLFALELKILDADVETIQTKRNINDVIKFSGSYDVTYMSDYSAKDSTASYYYQEILINLRTMLKPYLSLNVELANLNPRDEAERGGSATETPEEWGESRDANGLNMYFKQAYIEYSNNPSSLIKLGRQEIKIGDRTGLIYEGFATGFTQTCGIGTWCYSLTAINLSPNGHSALFGVSLDYPVWKSGKTIADPWAKNQERDSDSLSVEYYRIFHNAMDTPASQYGGWVADNTEVTPTVTTGHLRNGTDPVYVDNRKVEYNGLNVVWNATKVDMTFNYAKLNGTKEYHIGSSALGTYVTPFAVQENSAQMTRLQINYQVQDSWKLRLQALESEGTTQTSATQKPWDTPNSNFHEIQKGYHGDSLIYLTGYQFTGQGHSIANLNMQGIALSYKNPKESIYSWDFSFYSYARNQPVFNQDGQLVQEIGTEGNLKISFDLENDFTVVLFAAGFSAKEAFSPNEFTAPTATPSSITKVGTNIRFEF